MASNPVQGWWNSLTRDERLEVAEYMPEEARLDDWRTSWERLGLNQQVYLQCYFEKARRGHDLDPR